jgi:hypothetical protein
MISSADTAVDAVAVEVVEAAAPLKAEKVAAKVDVAKIRAETITTERPRLVRVNLTGVAGELAIWCLLSTL